MTTGGANKPTVGLVYPLQFEDALDLLMADAIVHVAPAPLPDEIAALARTADGVIIRGPAPLTAAHIEASPNLRVIAATGSGTNHIDLAAATARGIPVISGAGVAPQAIAEYVIGALIVARRRLYTLHEAFSQGTLDWSTRIAQYTTNEVFGATLGLVGLGHIGRAVARIAADGLQIRVLAYDPLIDAAIPGVTMLRSLSDLLEASDAVSIHVPLLPSTRGLLGREELRLIGPSGVLVNASRGGVVNDEALLEVLRLGQLGGAVVDVFDPEPPDLEHLSRMRATPNLLITPHIAGVTVQTRQMLERNAVEQVLLALRGERPTRLVNPTVVFP